MAEGSGSSSVEVRSGWQRLVTPSIPDVLFVAVLTTLVFSPLAVRLLGDADIGWQIRTGQLIAWTHAVPSFDPFSSAMAGKPWFAWEWLYDVAVGQLETWIGLNGVVWFSAVVIAAVFAFALQWLLRRGASVCSSVGLLLLALAASMIHMLSRPHLLSWLLAVIWFAILDRSERGGAKAIRGLWLLPVMMLLWVNVHGGFLIGYALLGIFWVAALWEWFHAGNDLFEQALLRISARKRAERLTMVGLLSVAASLVNPYGAQLHVHIWSYLSDRFLMDHIQEFQSPDFHGVAQRCFLVLLLISLVVITARGRKLRTSGLLVVLFAVYAGIYASRNIPISALLLAMVIGPLLPTEEGEGFFQRMAAMQHGLDWHLWPITAVALTFAVAANGGRVGSAVWMDAHFDPKRMPVAAVDYLEKLGANQPILSPDSWGGYLIFRHQRVVVDDRHDLYGEAFFKSYLKMVRGERGWPDFLRENNVLVVLFPRDSTLSSLLIQTAGWKVIYEDDVAAIFQRGP